MNPGESRRVQIPIFNKEIHITANDALGLQTYYLSHCPDLTGPTRILEESHSMSVSTGEYQYDYFYLNSGSRITLDVRQDQGASNVYVVHGEENLRTLESNSEVDFSQISDMKRYVAVSNHNEGTLSLVYKARRNDVYIVVYENAGFRSSSLQSHVVLQMTTYNLDGVTPICDESQDECVVSIARHKNCLLVQAAQRSDDNSTGGQDNQIVATAEIRGKRKWGVLFAWSLSPIGILILGLLHERISAGKRGGTGPSYSSVEPSVDETPPEPAPWMNPPAVAPHPPSDNAASNPLVLPTAPPDYLMSPPQAEAAFADDMNAPEGSSEIPIADVIQVLPLPVSK
jgi:Domain of unknown function (DUF4792)